MEAEPFLGLSTTEDWVESGGLKLAERFVPYLSVSKAAELCSYEASEVYRFPVC